jgi:flagellar motor switch protein FliG
LSKEKTHISTGLRKAAIFMIGLGTPVAAKILREMSEREVELLSRQMADLEKIDADEIDNASDEFREMVVAKRYMALGGIEYAKQALTEAFDLAHATRIIEKVKRGTKMHDLNGISHLHQDQFVDILNEEHPQTVAFILSQLESEQGGAIFAQLDPQLRNQVILRLVRMDKIDPSLVNDVEHVLSTMLDVKVQHEEVGGIDKTAGILNHVGQGIEKSMIELLTKEDPELALEVEKRMFTFEMIGRLEDRDIQRILRDVDLKDLSIALKVAKPELKETIYRNMSERARTMMEEEVEYLGKVRLRDVEAMQLKISMQIKQLVQKGEISMPTIGEKEVYV